MTDTARGLRPALILARMAVLTALGVVSGWALSGIPNVELVTAICFTAGYLLGIVAGSLTAVLTEALFAGLHPMGSTVGLVLLAQMTGMAFAALLGGLAAKLFRTQQRGFVFAAVVVGCGIGATLVFDLLTNLAFPLAAGFSFSQTLVTLAAAAPFAVIHVCSNALVFLLLVVPLLPRLEKVLRSP